jgi:hypothetical protein
VLDAADTLRAYGPDVLQRFFALKAQLDPDSLLESELSKRVFARLHAPASELAAQRTSAP